jgi:hypothetical protein
VRNSPCASGSETMKRAAQEGIQDHGEPIELVEVRSPEQLAVVGGVRALRPFTPAKRLLLRMPSVQAPLQHATERRLNFWLGVCGCKAGGLMFLAALAWQIGDPSRAHASILEAVVLGAGSVVAAGIVSKVATVLIARALFITEIALFLRRSATMDEKGNVSDGLQRNRSVDH